MRVYNLGNCHIDFLILVNLILWRIKLKVLVQIVLKVIPAITDMFDSRYLLRAQREVFICGDLFLGGPPHLIHDGLLVLRLNLDRGSLLSELGHVVVLVFVVGSRVVRVALVASLDAFHCAVSAVVALHVLFYQLHRDFVGSFPVAAAVTLAAILFGL